MARLVLQPLRSASSSNATRQGGCYMNGIRLFHPFCDRWSWNLPSSPFFVGTASPRICSKQSTSNLYRTYCFLAPSHKNNTACALTMCLVFLVFIQHTGSTCSLRSIQQSHMFYLFISYKFSRSTLAHHATITS